MNTRLFFLSLLFTLTAAKMLSAQDRLYYFSIQGNWDKQKQKDKAQFVGDNKLLSAYFHSYGTQVLRSGKTSGTGEISFKVRIDGTVDSLVFRKQVGSVVDSVVYVIVHSTSGKWRPGQVDGVKKEEVLTVWYNLYKGPNLKRPLEELIEDGKKFFEKGNFKNALNFTAIAMAYDPLNIDAIIIQAQALAGLNRKEEACELVNATRKFNNERLDAFAMEYCK